MGDIDTKTIIPILKQNDVAFAGIFGSRARGDNKQNSDLDLLIRFRKDDKSLLDVIGLENEISDKLKIKVDLVTEGGLHPYLRDSVYRDLKPIYGRR